MIKETEKKNPAIKILASSALATAIVSFIATAEGLDIYVFEHYWQAAIISAAIQGTLFAFSVSAIPLIKKLDMKGRVVLVVLWLGLLCSSSIFSYVYISKMVYSDRLLEIDSDRIISNICLEKYYELEEILDLQKDDLELQLNQYINLLDSNEEGIDLNVASIDKIKSVEDDLNKFKKKDIREIPPDLQKILSTIKEGKYSNNDIRTLNILITKELENVDIFIELQKEQRETLQNDINSINERLQTFRNINTPVYTDLNQEKKELIEKRDEIANIIEDMNKYKELLDNCQIAVASIEQTLEKVLYDSTLEIRTLMNAESLDADKLQKCVEKIYSTLKENHISASDERLTGYREFRNNIEEYKVVIASKNKIGIALEKIYVYSEDKEKKVEEWRVKLDEIKDILKNIPQKYFTQYNEKLIKSDIIDLLSSLDRLYLSDLNEFERAWSLLFSSVHIYKVLLIFSAIFAFGMDLFSFAAGMLLYFMNKQK